MTIQFDDGAADSLIAAASDAATVLADQGFGRRGAAETASEDFSGAYARLFEAACVIEAEDRGKLAGVLDELVIQVENAKAKASEEKQRIADLAAWTEHEETRERTLPGILDINPDFNDPKPSETPVSAPPISAPFAARDRNRSPGAGSAGKSSADHADLMTWVMAANTANAAMQKSVSNVKAAWTRFTSGCSWVNFGSTTFVIGFEKLLEENESDADWIERIAAAFELAGNGGALSPTNPVNDALIGAVSETFNRYRGRLRIPGTGADIPTEFLNSHSSAKDANWMREFYKGEWYSINPETGIRAPVGSWGAAPLSPAAENPKGWHDRYILTPNSKFGAPPAWAKAGGKGLGALGGGLTLWGSYADSYNSTLEEHPDWSNDRRDQRAREDMMIIGGSSIGGSVLAGLGAGAAIGSIAPGAGTAVGAIVGVLVGLGAGVLGGLAGQEFGQSVSDWYHGEDDAVILAPGPYDQPLLPNEGML